MIRLTAKTGVRLDSWCNVMWRGYHQSLIDAGYSDAEASANVERNSKALFLAGRPNAEQRVLDVFDDDVAVGTLWLAHRVENGLDTGWYVYDVEIDVEHRGRGLGRATMLAAEEYVKDHGGARLSLNVFGTNAVARSLYESLGYATMAIAMRKDLR